MTELIPSPAAPLGPLADLGDRARQYAEQSKAENTKRAYKADWRHFETWCERYGLASLPALPGTVARYVTALADGTHAEPAQPLKVSTIGRRLASISQAHQLAGQSSPTDDRMLRTVMQGIRRALGSAPRQKAPAVTEVVRQLVDTLPAGLAGTRDRALLLLGFAGAFRRSELVALDVADLDFQVDGLVVTVRRSKTDQEGQGVTKGIPYGSNPETCPIRSLRRWLDAAELVSGAVFRPVDRHGNVRPSRLTAQTVAIVVKRCAAAADLDPSGFSGHSLRAGLATAAAAAGVADRDIMRQTGHKSDRVLRGYIRRGNLFRDNAAGKVGL